MATRAELEERLRNLEATLRKVQGELNLALHPPERTFTITGLFGVFADDTGIAIGDVCHAVVVRGAVADLRGDGVWGGIAPSTIVEYYVTHGGVNSAKAIEAFYSNG